MFDFLLLRERETVGERGAITKQVLIHKVLRPPKSRDLLTAEKKKKCWKFGYDWTPFEPARAHEIPPRYMDVRFIDKASWCHLKTAMRNLRNNLKSTLWAHCICVYVIQEGHSMRQFTLLPYLI